MNCGSAELKFVARYVVKNGSKDIQNSIAPVDISTFPFISFTYWNMLWWLYHIVKHVMKLFMYAKNIIFNSYNAAMLASAGCGNSRTMIVIMIAITASTNASSLPDSIFYSPYFSFMYLFLFFMYNIILYCSLLHHYYLILFLINIKYICFILNYIIFFTTFL